MSRALAAPAVVGLSYALVHTAELDTWRRLGTDLLGMAPSPLHVPGGFALRMDERIARFIIEPSDTAEGIAATGWEVAGRKEWECLLATLDKFGVEAQPGTTESAAARGVADYIRVVDPSGSVVEFCYSPITEPIVNMVSPNGVRFVTGEQGLGHLTQVAADYEATVDFYVNILGFHVRETIDLGIRATFLGCNSRQHALAIIDGRGANAYHHIMVEVDSIDDVGRALDKVNAGAARLTVGLGRHWDDKMISFYMASPSGFQIEYGYGGIQVDPQTWTETRQGGRGGASLWGHIPVQAMEGFGPASN